MQTRHQKLKKELDRIISTLRDKYCPEKIILFGSLATGRIGKWSDIDLVIIKNTPQRFMDRLKEVMLLTQPEVGVDFLVYTPQEFEQAQKDDWPFLRDEILAKGKVVYSRE